MLADRLKTSAILITVVILCLVLDYNVVFPQAEGIWLFPLLMVLALGTAWEISTMLSAAGLVISRPVAMTATGLICASSVVPMLWALSENPYPATCPIGRIGWIVLGGVAAMFWILLSEMRSYGVEGGEHSSQKTGDTIRRTCHAAFVSLYIGLPMAMLVGLRSMHSASSAGRFGFAALITMIIVTKVSDAGAYFSGRALGRHKLIPRLSPGKTIEGAIGGIFTSTLVAYLCLGYLFPWLCSDSPLATTPGTILEAGFAGSNAVVGSTAAAGKTGLAGMLASPFWGALLLGPTLAISGMVGDLAESLFKRDSGVKDSGKLLPGLGGVWDVTDSLIAASVPAFFCFAAGVGGP